MSAQPKKFYKRPIFFIPVVAVAVPIIWVAWWLGSPLFIDKTVNEDLPEVAIASATTQTPASAAPASAPPDADPAPSPSPAEGEPAAVPVTEPATQQPAGTLASTPDPAPVTTTAPDQPGALLSGMFKDADSRHRGSGDAAIYELVDGSLLLRVEDLDVTNGPDLHVFLSPGPDATERADVMGDGYVDLGKLKGNKGNQNYEIPADFDLDGEWTVVIYCVPFHVIFSTAPLS